MLEIKKNVHDLNTKSKLDNQEWVSEWLSLMAFLGWWTAIEVDVIHISHKC